MLSQQKKKIGEEEEFEENNLKRAETWRKKTLSISSPWIMVCNKGVLKASTP